MPNDIDDLHPARLSSERTITLGSHGEWEDFPNDMLDEILDSDYTKEGLVSAMRYRNYTRYSKDATWVTVKDLASLWKSKPDGEYDIVIAYDTPSIFRTLTDITNAEGYNYSLTFDRNEDGKLWLSSDQEILVITR